MSAVDDFERREERIYCRERGEGRKLVAAPEGFGLIPLQCIVSTAHITSANIAVDPLTAHLPWSSHLWYINRFFLGVSDEREPGV